MTFDQLFKAFDWKPIRNCPGRFVLRESKLSLQELLGSDAEAVAYQVPTARDTVLVLKLESGGLISYERADGLLLHTLNTPEGFCRKLFQLGISLSS
jgi:hypothetical protein